MDLARMIERKVQVDGICNIIIAGGTCSGKTTLANYLQSRLSKEFSVSLIKQDDYYKDIQDVPKIRDGYLMDSPNAFHSSEFRQDAEKLLLEGKTIAPRYDMAQNKRISKDIPINRSQVNIFEGLHTLSMLEGLPDSLAIFLDTPLDVCLERRINRDTELYGVPIERVRENFNDCIAPMYHSYIAPQMEKAEVKMEGVDLCGTA